MTPIFEIVHVIDAHTVVDIESYQREWTGKVDKGPGFYVLKCAPAEDDSGRPADDECVAGPFKCLDEALAAAVDRGFSRFP